MGNPAFALIRISAKLHGQMKSKERLVIASQNRVSIFTGIKPVRRLYDVMMSL